MTLAKLAPANPAGEGEPMPKNGKRLSLAAKLNTVTTAVGGARAEALLLERILFWLPQAAYVDKDGTRWLIRTLQEFIEDGLQFYSLRTIRRTLKALEDKGLIRTRRGYHHFRPGEGKMSVKYVTINEKAEPDGGLKVAKMAETIGPKGPVPTVESGQNVHFLYLQGNSFQGNETGEQGASAQPPTATTGATSSESQIENSPEPKSPPSSETKKNLSARLKAKQGSIRAGSVASPPTPAVSPKLRMQRATKSLQAILDEPRADPLERPARLSGKYLHIRFREAFRAAYPGEMAPDGGTVRQKWLNEFTERMRAANCTDDDICGAIDYVVGNWQDFRDFVKARSGWKLAERPFHLVFLQQTDQVFEFAKGAKRAAAAPVQTMTLDEAMGLVPVKGTAA